MTVMTNTCSGWFSDMGGHVTTPEPEVNYSNCGDKC